MSRLLFACAHWTYPSMCCCSQVSPCAIVPSSILLLLLGRTKETVGSCVESLGKSVSGRFTVGGTLLGEGLTSCCQHTHGLWSRSYPRLLHPVKPTEGRSSA